MQLATLCLAIRTHSQTFCPVNRRILDILRIPLDAHVSEAEYPYGILMCVCVCVKGRLTRCQKKCIAGRLTVPPFARDAPIRPGFVAAVRCDWLVRPSSVAAENRPDLLGLLPNWPTRFPLGCQLHFVALFRA